jgi:hypothetical protein
MVRSDAVDCQDVVFVIGVEEGKRHVVGTQEVSQTSDGHI